MGYRVQRDFGINERLRKYIYDNSKKPSVLADKAGIRRDTFSAILGCRRPIYAEEIVSICNAVGCTVQFLLGLDTKQKQEEE